jgi:hypothetical protein
MASAKEASPMRDSSNDDMERRGTVADVEKGRWERLWPVSACGAGLFSDGYLNNVRRLQSNNLPSNTSRATISLPRDMVSYATAERHLTRSNLLT